MNREEYVRVSTVLSSLQDFSHIPVDVLSAKADLGSSVHASIEDFLHGEFPIVTGREIGYFNSFCKWYEVMCPNVIHAERRYWDDLKSLTGQIDVIVKLKGHDESILVDWKTSAQESSLVWPLQAHLYFYLLKQNFISVAPYFFFIRLHPRGLLPYVHRYEFSEKTLSYVLHLVDSYWKKKSG